MLLSAFLGAASKQQAQIVSEPFNRRADERYEAYQPVSIGLPGRRVPVEGTVINISLGGAAVVIPGWGTRSPARWLKHLERGDELRMAGLLDEVVSCRVVSVDIGVLRVRFSRDEVLRGQLRELIDGLAPL
jgi:hypothetical protein